MNIEQYANYDIHFYNKLVKIKEYLDLLNLDIELIYARDSYGELWYEYIFMIGLRPFSNSEDTNISLLEIENMKTILNKKQVDFFVVKDRNGDNRNNRIGIKFHH